ncbi:LacI family DNA-binding transcriptional regulator [Butyrivibrio sp. LC3010]|uniref:LacI family DNA-binding transcriptional regulator n=1 Tax=Butyrivibrio sp. LC3010 TaxID=1280680 RepID=UPI0003FC8689|nr:LacI family DNA-binding transcriptional regulator [Butyrivibrio sp. LC3010]
MTSKELAKLLGLSETAVSFALNDKTGVSEKTRSMVKKAAIEHGMTPGGSKKHKGDGIIHIVQYISFTGTTGNDFFRDTIDGIEFTASELGIRTVVHYVTGYENLERELKELETCHASGMLILGFIIEEREMSLMSFCSFPICVIEAHFTSSKIDFIEINNRDAGFMATNYLIKKRACQPGCIRSTTRTYDFDQRTEGFYDALKYNMMTKSKSIMHEITASTIEDAEAEMLEIIDRKEELAPSYFAENDILAIGAMRAFQKRGYRVPEDISIIGFDDITVSSYVEPPLTTIHIPRNYIGRIATERLYARMTQHDHMSINIHINGYLVKRGSVAPLSSKNVPQ